jgi:hypothetical protein
VISSVRHGIILHVVTHDVRVGGSLTCIIINTVDCLEKNMRIRNGTLLILILMSVSLLAKPLPTIQLERIGKSHDALGWTAPPSVARSWVFVKSNRTDLPHPTFAGLTVNSIKYSYNWAGYAFSATGVTQIWGKWAVPSVASSPTGAYSSTWIGIGGYTESTLIQTGTSQEIDSSGNYHYYAWYELLPAGPVTLFNVSPGDLMYATISYQSGTTWNIYITDVTAGSGHTSNTNVQYTSSFGSAEWIHEAPCGAVVLNTCVDWLTLANTSDALFYGAEATVGGTSKFLGDFSYDQLVMDDPNSGSLHVRAEPGCLPAGAPGTSKDRFAVTYDDNLAQIPPLLLDCSISSQSAHPGDTLTFSYYIFNDNPSSTTYGLGASIRQTGTSGEIDDTSHDITVSAPSGSTWQSRQFYIQLSTSIGTYDWSVAVWSGTPGQSGRFTTSGWDNGGLQINPSTYSVTFAENNIPSGTSWGVTVGGTHHSTSSGTSIPVSGLSGTVSYTYDSPVAGSGGSYVCTSSCSSSVSSAGTVTATYTFSSQTEQISVSTDKTGYAQGESVQYTASGFIPGDAVLSCLTTSDVAYNGLCVGQANADGNGNSVGSMFVGTNIPVGPQMFWVQDNSKNPPVASNLVQLTITAQTQTLTTNVDAGQGSVSPPCTSGCSETVGSSQTVTATPSSGWQFSSWSTQNGQLCSSNPCVFSMPNNQVTLKATFSPQVSMVSSVIFPASAGSDWFIGNTNPYDNQALLGVWAEEASSQNIGLWTSDGWADKTTGRPLVSGNLVVVAGPLANKLTSYYQSQGLTVGFRWGNVNGVSYAQIVNRGQVLAQMPESEIGSGKDIFVVQAIQDNDGRLVLMLWGIGAQGTLASGVWFVSNYSTLGSLNNSIYVYSWVDANGDGFPQPGEITLIYQGN